MIRCGQPGSHNLLDFFLSLQQTKPTCSKSIHGSQRAKVPEVELAAFQPFRHVDGWGLSRCSRSVVRLLLRNHRRRSCDGIEEKKKREKESEKKTMVVEMEFS